MTPADAFRTATNRTPVGWSLVDEVESDTRDLRIYTGPNRELALGFGPTKGDVWPNPSPDWRENFDVKLVPSPFGLGRVQKGFLEEFQRLLEPVTRALHVHQPDLVRLTGFSQGAILATYTFRHLLAHGTTALRGLAVASPNGFDREGARDFNRAVAQAPAATFRQVRAWGDPVPMLPPWLSSVGPVTWIGPHRITPNLRFPSPVHNGDYYLTHLEASS